MIEHLAVGGLTGKDVRMRVSCSRGLSMCSPGGAGSCRRPLALWRRSPLITCHFCHVRFVVTAQPSAHSARVWLSSCRIEILHYRRAKSLSAPVQIFLDRHGSKTRWKEGKRGLCADTSANRSSRQGHGYRPVEGLFGHSYRGVQHEGWQVGNGNVIWCSNVLTGLVGI
jgi:hypothetical protein